MDLRWLHSLRKRKSYGKSVSVEKFAEVLILLKPLQPLVSTFRKSDCGRLRNVHIYALSSRDCVLLISLIS